MAIYRNARFWAAICRDALVIAGCFIVYALPNLGFPTGTLDGGWMYAINHAAAIRLGFGRDLIFTFGPFAGVYTNQYDPTIDGRLLAASICLAAAMASGLLSLARGPFRYAVLAVPLAMASMASPDGKFLALPAVFLLVCGRIVLPRLHPDRLAIGPLPVAGFLLQVAGLALLPLIKGSLGSAALFIIGLTVAMLLWARAYRLAAAEMLIFVAVLVGAWTWIGQDPSMLLGFFIEESSVVSGYTAAMALRGSLLKAVLSAACLAALVAVAGRGLVRRSGSMGYCLTAGLAVLAFFAFKAGFVRADAAHTVITANFLLVTGLLLVFGATPRTAGTTVALGVAGWAMIIASSGGADRQAFLPGLQRDLRAQVTEFRERLSDATPLRRRYQNALLTIQQEAPLSDLTDPGRIDIYPYDLSLPLAYGFHWSPRPVFQSYSAYTPSLTELNAQHLLGAEAPDTVLFKVAAIDGRLPSLEDGPSWPILLRDYRITNVQAGFAVLRHIPGAASNDSIRTATPIMRATLGMGEWMELPRGQPLWARVVIHPTLAGQLASVLFRLPELRITLRYPGDIVRQFRFIAGIGETGFLLSPTVGNTADFMALSLPQHTIDKATEPAAMAITGTSGTRLAWPGRFEVTLGPLAIPVRASTRALLAVATQTDGRSMHPGGECVLDSLGEGQPKPSEAISGSLLRLQGWAAIAPSTGMAARSASVTLTGADHIVHAAPVALAPRPDVGAFFQHPEMGPSGFSTILDVSGLTGDYALGIALAGQATTLYCDFNRSVHLSGGSD